MKDLIDGRCVCRSSGVRTPELLLPSRNEGRSGSAKDSLPLWTACLLVSLLLQSCSRTSPFFPSSTTYFHPPTISSHHFTQIKFPLSLPQLCFDVKHMRWKGRVSVLRCLTVQWKCIAAGNLRIDARGCYSATAVETFCWTVDSSPLCVRTCVLCCV